MIITGEKLKKGDAKHAFLGIGHSRKDLLVLKNFFFDKFISDDITVLKISVNLQFY